MKNLTPEEKKIIENAWDIIRTLSPESVPVDKSRIDESIFGYKKLQQQKDFKQDISKIKQCLDNIYDDCPYSDNHDITILLSDARQAINILITKL